MSQGEWGTVTFEVPDFLAPVRKTVNDVAEFLVAVLDIALQILQFVKAFLVGFLDPIIALVQAILDEIEALIRDFRQLGLYITGDWKLLKYPFDDLRGGFSEYERRMIARLTDRTDPTRPNVSGRTAVLSLFLYLSVDISDIQRLVAFIMKIIQFFNQSFFATGGPPVPLISSVLYGADAASILHPTTLGEFFALNSTPPQLAQVKWTLSPTTSKSPFNPFPPIPPGGFLLTVSTFENGIPVVFDRPRPNTNMQPSAANPSQIQQPRDYGVVRTKDASPLRLYGGADMIIVPEGLSYNNSLNARGVVKPGRTRIYGMQSIADSTVIPLEKLKDGDTYYFQRTFKVPLSETFWQAAGGEFSHVLKLEDMPHDAKITKNGDGTMKIEDAGTASVVYVRVASATQGIGNETLPFQYNFADSGFLGQFNSTPIPFPPVPMLQDGDVSCTDISAFSLPQQVVFPNANTAEYLKAVQTALVVLILSRPDLILLDQLKTTLPPEVYKLVKDNKSLLPGIALETCGLEGLRYLVDFVYDDYKAELKRRGTTAGKFRKDLLNAVSKFAHDIYGATGPLPEAEANVVQSTEYLRRATWGMILGDAGYSDLRFQMPLALESATILESLDTDTPAGGDPYNGLAITPYNLGVPEERMPELFEVKGLFQGRTPQMQEMLSIVYDPTFELPLQASPTEAKKLLSTNAPGLRTFYEQYIQKDGSILVPEKDQEYLKSVGNIVRWEGSADDSPVFFVNRNGLTDLRWWDKNPTDAGIVFCRGIFARAKTGQLFQEAALALGIAASTFTRSPDDGAWIAVRLFDSLPGLDNFFATIRNWLQAIRAALQSIIDTIRKYIEFIEGRIVELQQLIRRINALIQSLLGFAFQIPKASALLLVSNGTGGVVADLASAKTKPFDSPLAYGAGIAVVIPFGPALVMDFIKFLFATSGGTPQPGEYMAAPPPPFGDAIGLGALPPPAPAPGDDVPPDVL